MGIIGHDLIMLSMFKKHYTNEGVKQTGKVSVNMVNEAMLDRADYVGCASGAKADKSDVFVYHLGEAGMPVIDETTPARIALGWLLAQKPWIVPIPGTKRIERIEENIGGADIQFTPEELADIRRHLDNIEIVGGRYPEDQEKMTGL